MRLTDNSENIPRNVLIKFMDIFIQHFRQLSQLILNIFVINFWSTAIIIVNLFKYIANSTKLDIEMHNVNFVNVYCYYYNFIHNVDTVSPVENFLFDRASFGA
jgi:hypothetical protein